MIIVLDPYLYCGWNNVADFPSFLEYLGVRELGRERFHHVWNINITRVSSEKYRNFTNILYNIIIKI